MRDLLSKVLYGSSLPQGSNDGSQILSIRASPQDGNLFHVVPDNAPSQAPPLYSITKRDSKPNYIVSRGFPAPDNTVATAAMHVSSTTVDLSVHNQPMVLKTSGFSENFSFETPHMGKFKWKPNQLTGSSYELYDQTGRKLAKFGSAGITRMGEKQLTIFVPCDEFFTVTIVLSIVSLKELNKITEKVAGKIIGEVVGGI
ncbi:hypothetical protein FALBO_5966 [Fusarium albosuccineum]|uniref:Uncharacterized protein n=1 Tax=Fusarium albosuccineum TaxID=1237068 RepID=A0A8H4LFI6_9HYPO|nr:hypothetical protein FALBO_5966 [Fusarium albosuccineum]KAF5008625.1 hypothetical protein FDECE_5115 [Fusarium decemcellulare]